MAQSPDGVRSEGPAGLELPSLAQRAGDTVSGAAKTYGASLANTAASLYDLTQGGRDVMNREYLEAAQLKYDQAKRDYEETEALAKSDPANKRWQKDLEASRNMLEAAERELLAYGAVPEIQRGAAQQSYAAADQLAASGQKDIDQAKTGLNGLGKFVVDVGVGGVQLGADIAGGVATGGGTMLPLLLRSYGGGAQEARQEGATAQQAAAYGAASALTEALTEKISSLGNFQTKAFGSGALDNVLEGVVGAVERLGKTSTGRALLNRAASAGVGFLAEGAEEFVSGVVNPLLKRAAYSNAPIDWKKTMEDAAYEFLVGGGIGMISGGIGGTDTSRVQGQYLSGVTEQAQNDAYRAMKEKGLFSPEARAAARNAVAQMDETRERTGMSRNFQDEVARQLTGENARSSAETGREGQGKAEDVSTTVRMEAAHETAENGPGDGGQKNTAVKETADKADAREVVAKLQASIPTLQDNPVTATMKGTEFGKSGGKLTEQVGAFFERLGNSVFRSGLGNVILDKRGVKSDIAHGIGRAKAITFAAIPDVIAKGTQIDYQKNWKGRGYDTYIVAAPVDLAGQRSYVAAVIRSDAENRFYLHEVVGGDGELIYKIDAPAAIKTGVTAENGITGTAEASAEAGNTGQLLNMPQSGPQLTSEAPNGAGVSSSTASVSQAGTEVNRDVKKDTSLDGERRGPKVASPGVSSDVPVTTIQQTPANVKRGGLAETAGTAEAAGSGYEVMMLGRLVRMGETGETAARLGALLGRAADGGALTAGEWSEIQANPNAAKLVDAAKMIAQRSIVNGAEATLTERSLTQSGNDARRGTPQSAVAQTQNVEGVQQNAEQQTESVRLPVGQAERGDRAGTGGPGATVQNGTVAGPDGVSEQGGSRAEADGKADGAVDRSGGRQTAQNIRAIARQDATIASGARAVSTREYMGLDMGTDRPCLFDVPEDVIRSDRVLSEVYDEIWEMGYRPHFFTGTPETDSEGFIFNGAVRGEDVYIRADDSRHDVDAIWKHERFHILSAEDGGLRAAARDALLEKYGQTELEEMLGRYLERYRGAYGMETAQGLWELSDGDIDMLLEELLADAYAGMNTARTEAGKYRDGVREIAGKREQDERTAGGPQNGTKFSIRETSDGKRYVQADRLVISGNDPEVWAEQVENYINSKIRHGEDVELLTEDGDTLLLTKDTAGKAKHAWHPDGSRMSDAEYETKLNAESHIDELAQVSVRGAEKKDFDGRHGALASGGWQYRKAYFRDFNGKYYQVWISVAKGDAGNVVYNVGRIIERNFPAVSGSSAKGGAQKGGEASFNGSISQSGQDVKRVSPPRGDDGLRGLELPSVNQAGNIRERSPSTTGFTASGSSVKDGAQGGKTSFTQSISQPGQDVKGLELPPVESSEREDTGDVRFSASDEETGLRLPDVPDRTETDGGKQETAVPAVQRREASKKLTGSLYEIFPETSRTYLRDIADEIRSGAGQEQLEAMFQDTYDSAMVYDESPEAVELREIAHELRGRRVYADQGLREEFGDDWNDMRRFFFGKGVYFTNDSGDIGLDQLNSEMASRFGGRFNEYETDMGSVISRMEYILRKGAAKQVGLDEQARQYGGEEAVEQFREAYRQRFMDAAEEYRETMEGIDEAGRKAREAERARRRQELEDYVDQARQTLRERAAQGLDTGKTDPRTHIPAGMDIDAYTETLEERAARAREERLRSIPREEFQGSEAMEKLGIRISGGVTDQYRNAKALRDRQAAAAQAKRVLRHAERRLDATAAEKQFAAGITSGIYTENDIPSTMDADKVMELADYYMGERAFGMDMLRQQKADISRAQQEKAKAIFGPALEAGEGKKKLIGGVMGMFGDAFAMNNRTAERNMLSIFGDEAGERINQWLFAPVAENEGERYRFVNRMMDRVRKIEGRDGKKTPLTKAESALVQKVIEGRAAAEAVAGTEMEEAVKGAAERLNEGGEMQDIAREFKLDAENRRLARQYAVWLEAKQGLETADKVKIENAAALYSEIYEQFYEAVNDFLTVHGYEPIGFIKGYAPHMQPKETTGALQRAFQALGAGADVNNLPTAIAGQTKDFKPGKRWNRFFQTRHGEQTEYDIVGGFEQYVDSLSDVLYHTDDIARIREANKFLRRMYAQEEISENLSRAEELKFRSAAEKRAFLMDQGELDANSALSEEDINRKMNDYSDKLYGSVQNTTQYGQLAVYLDDYANLLAGKQVFADRDMERTMGRASLNVGNKLHRAFTRAQVAGNLSSVLNQTSQLPIILAELGGKYTRHALLDNFNGRLRRGGWALESDFLTEKNGIDYITNTPQDMIVGALFKPAGFVDGLLSTLAVRGRYLKEIDEGKSHREAMRIADRFGRSVMGSRAKGSAPMAFQSKSLFNRMIHAFQLEALNTWEHLGQDLPREFRAIEKSNGKAAAARAMAGVAAKILIGNFLLNRVSDFLYGGTPAQGDVLGIMGNFVASGMGTTLNAVMMKIINAGWEKITGEPLFDDGDDDEDEDRPFDWNKAAEQLGGDMMNDAPIVSNAAALFGIGDRNLPMPDIGTSAARAVEAWNDDGGFSWEVARQLMGLAGDLLPGGRQAEKTFQGLDTALRGGRFRGYGEDERLMYPVDDSPLTAVQAALFGNSALEESGEYYAGGETALSQKQTALYQDMVRSGGDRKEIYNAILDWRRINGDDDLTSAEKARLGEAIVGDTGLDDREKLRFYKGLTKAESRAEKLEALMDAGMDWDGAIGAYAMYDEINRKEQMSASEKAAEFARWADENYQAAQAKEAKSQFKYYNMVPAEAGRYEKLAGAGLETDAAYRVSELLSALKPEEGKKQVSPLQKYQVIISGSTGLSQSEQREALEAVMSESEQVKFRVGYEQGITPEMYVRAKEAVAGYDEDGNGSISQDEAKKAIKAMSGLSKEQKAVLWQIQNKSWNADSNPFSMSTGRKVKKVLAERSEELTLPEP